MTQNAITIDSKTDGSQGVRIRVRTPGKYLILMTLVVVCAIAFVGYASMQLIERGSINAMIEYRKSAEGVRTAYYSLPEFLIDLSPDKNGRTAYLKMRADIKIGDSDVNSVVTAMEEAGPLLSERLSFFLRELRPEDFSGSADMEMVKEEMLRRVNLVIAPTEAEAVIIREIAIQ